MHKAGDDGSRWSLWSQNSVLSIGSRNSVLSIGSIGSVLSIGSVGSAGSLGSVGSFVSVGCLMSGLSLWSVMTWKAKRSMVLGGAMAISGIEVSHGALDNERGVTGGDRAAEQ
jgi:hypothetical protein